jgi:N6-L-threonylcarbamoyladenine synthase
MSAAWRPGLVLGIESSCDETAAAVIDCRESVESPRVLSDVIASQVQLHAPNGGVVPEVACRQHLKDMGPVVSEALERADVVLGDLSGIAVTAGPGLVGALLVGTSYAKSLALAADVPLAGVHHLAGHVRAAFLRTRDQPLEAAPHEPEDAYLALVVSGGHTSLFRVTRDGGSRRYDELARTLDDAAGEAFDKAGKLLGLGYPAGPRIDRLVGAYKGDRVYFPRARIKVDGGRSVTRRAFSFSGIKTSVRHHARQSGMPPLSPGERAEEREDLLATLAGFQDAVVDMLVTPTIHVLREERLSFLVAVGGVSANSQLRAELAAACAREGVELRIPPPRWSTDNAAMIAAQGALELAAGRHATLALNADPALALEPVA